MIDHLSIGVSDLVAARRFYDALFVPLGHAASFSSTKELAYGPAGASRQFFLYPVAGDQIAGLGTHVAFTAPDRVTVDGAYEAALREGAVSLRMAGLHPDISPDYYGAVFLDPDGNKIEIVAGFMH